MRILFLSDTHLGFDMPSRPRVVRRRRGEDFFQNFERALAAVETAGIDVVVHGGDLLYRSRVPAWLAEAALAPLKRVASSGTPVLLVPGNHERGRLPFPLLAIDEQLHVFDRPRTIVLERGGVRAAFTGFPYTPDVRRRFRELLRAADGGAASADVRVLCMHQAVEGATCGPGNFTFTFGPDVVRANDLPRDLAVTLSGHIHRHQVLRPEGRGPVIYAGSVERTSFAEAPETKGYVVLDLTPSSLGAVRFQALPARPMAVRKLAFGAALPADARQSDASVVRTRVAAAIASTPPDAVVQLRIEGDIPTSLTSKTLRELAGARTVSLASYGMHARRRLSQTSFPG